MVPFIIIVVVIAVAAIGWWLFSQQRDGRAAAAGPRQLEREFGRLLKEEREFHIQGSTAKVTFDVTVPATGADQALKELMLRQGGEVLRKKRSHDLPIGSVTELQVYGMRDGAAVLVASAPIEDVHELMPVDTPTAAPHASAVDFDPLETLGEIEPAATPGVAARTAGDELPAVGTELRLTAGLDDALKAQGIDAKTASLSQLTLGLLDHAGYTLTPGKSEGTFVATGVGRRTFLQIVEHEPGGYPELDETAVNQFMYSFIESGTERGLLFSDKFGPYLVYSKEKREPRVRFITRERLQSFVDSVAIG